VRAIVEGALVGNFDPDYYRSDRKDQKIDALTILASGERGSRSSGKAAHEAQIIGESQNFTRDLVNEPSNRMTPTILGDRAKKMCQETGLKCEVYGADKIKELKMGAFWSVAQGSDEPPTLIVMTYEPAGAPAKPVLGLVGKGITFDTGGISIKPADGMEKMKYDMAGGATMIGAMRAIAHAQAESESHRHRLCHGKHAVWQSAEAGRCADCDVRQSRSRSSIRMPKAGWCWPTAFSTRANSAAHIWSMQPR
jgi:leucyl aminopeptidase